MNKGFYAKVVASHPGLKFGEVVYMKLLEKTFKGPTLYGVLDEKTGKTINYADANEFNNRFEVIK